MASIKRTRLGRHILVDFFGVGSKKLQDRKRLMEVLRSALKKGGFNIAVFFNGIKENQRKKIAQYINQFLPKSS